MNHWHRHIKQSASRILHFSPCLHLARSAPSRTGAMADDRKSAEVAELLQQISAGAMPFMSHLEAAGDDGPEARWTFQLCPLSGHDEAAAGALSSGARLLAADLRELKRRWEQRGPRRSSLVCAAWSAWSTCSATCLLRRAAQVRRGLPAAGGHAARGLPGGARLRAARLPKVTICAAEIASPALPPLRVRVITSLLLPSDPQVRALHWQPDLGGRSVPGGAQQERHAGLLAAALHPQLRHQRRWVGPSRWH